MEVVPGMYGTLRLIYAYDVFLLEPLCSSFYPLLKSLISKEKAELILYATSVGVTLLDPTGRMNPKVHIS